MSLSNYFEDDAALERSWDDSDASAGLPAFAPVGFLLPTPHTLSDATLPSETDICLFDPLGNSSAPSSRRESDDSVDSQGVPKRR
jgi:hypothetical protein